MVSVSRARIALFVIRHLLTEIVAQPIERLLTGRHYFLIQSYLRFRQRAAVVRNYFRMKRQGAAIERPEVSFLIYAKACERMLIPIVAELLQSEPVRSRQISVNLIVLNHAFPERFELLESSRALIAEVGGEIQNDHTALVRASLSPNGKVAVCCLDSRRYPIAMRPAIDAFHRLSRRGVATVCVQHGGSRRDSIEDLSESESRTLFVWGERIKGSLTDDFGVDSNRIRVVGNPLHDSLVSLDSDRVKMELAQRYRLFDKSLGDRKIIVLATILRFEYGNGHEAERHYRRYIQHVYDSIDFSQAALIVKMHSNDFTEPNLYRQWLPEGLSEDDVAIVQNGIDGLDVYGLMSLADLVITRASAIAEEALVMGRRVIAFDLDSDGPTRFISHLLDSEAYSNVFADPPGALSDAIAEALASEMPQQKRETLIREFTWALDGCSRERAVAELLRLISPAAC